MIPAELAAHLTWSILIKVSDNFTRVLLADNNYQIANDSHPCQRTLSICNTHISMTSCRTAPCGLSSNSIGKKRNDNVTVQNWHGHVIIVYRHNNSIICNVHQRNEHNYQHPTFTTTRKNKTVQQITTIVDATNVVVVVDPTPPTCCQQSPAPESCGSQQSLPPGDKERLHFVGIHPEVQARKGGW